MNFNKMLWGIVLILIGLLLILENLNFINFYWMDLFSLWPTLLIFWGITLLPIRSFWKAILTSMVLVVAVLFTLRDNQDHKILHPENHSFFFFHRDNDKDNQYKENKRMNQDIGYQQEQFPYLDTTIKKASLDFDGAAGKFAIIEITNDYLFDLKKRGNLGQYEINSELEDSSYRIDIELNNQTIRRRNDFNEATIKLNPEVLWSMSMNLGAADVLMDLTQFKVAHIDIEGGASQVDIKLGERYHQTYVELESGASSFVLNIPESSGCRVIFDTFLARKSMEGFEQVSKKEYVTPDYQEQDQQIDVVVKAAVSKFEVKKY